LHRNEIETINLQTEHIRLSVIVPVHDASEYLIPLLNSLQHQLCDEIEVICVNDASTDDSLAILNTYPWVHVENRLLCGGAGACRNSGAQIARGEYLLFLDADTRVRDLHLLRKVITFFDQHDDIEALSGCYHDHNQNRTHFARYIDSYEKSLRLNSIDKAATGSLSGSICGIRKSIFLSIGGFDENSLVIMEDADLGCRLGAQGYKHFFSGEFRVEHWQPGFWHYCSELVPRTRHYFHLLRTYGVFNEVMGAKSEGVSRAIASMLLLCLPWLAYRPAALLTILLTFALVITRMPLWSTLWREQGPRLVFLGIGYYLTTTMAMMLGASLGIIDFLHRGLDRKIADLGVLWNYVRSLTTRYSPGYLILFLTHRCNANCGHCFDHEQRTSISKDDELTLDQIRELGSNLGKIAHLSLTGGEPFLREDLPEIVEALYNQGGVRSFSISTNGSFPDRIKKIVPKIMTLAPGARIILTLSYDGTGSEHDRLRGLNGLFAKTEASYQQLVRIRQWQPRLYIHGCMTLTNANSNSILDTVDFLESKKFDQIELNMLRGKPADSAIKAVPSAIYHRVMGAAKQANKKDGINLGLSWVFKLLDRVLFDIVHQSDRPWPCGTCVAGSKLLVIHANGNVLPCEMLNSVRPELAAEYNDFILGNITDQKGDLTSVMKSDNSLRIKDLIRESQCHCSFECGIMATLAYRPWYLPRLLLRQGMAKKIQPEYQSS